MTFIVQDTRLVTISNQDNAYIIEQMVRYLESHVELSIYKLLFAGLEWSVMLIIRLLIA